jgi:protein SCO1/2
MKRSALIVMVALVALLTLLACVVAARLFVIARMRPEAPRSTIAAAPTTPKTLWPAPDFAYPDQDNRPVTRRQLIGHVWIADFIFTQCRSACPLLTARMVMLQRQLAHFDVRFVSFSVDPEHDTPAALKQYAGQWHVDEARWRLLSTTPAALQATAAGLRLMVAATGDAHDPIIHSNRFVLIDSAGLVRGAYDSSDEDDMKRLLADAERLPGATAVPGSASALVDHEPTSGPALFEALGCRGCHERPEVAPPLDGLFGSSVTLADDRRIVADEAYLRDSISSPSTAVVAGYGSTMPSYAGQLSDRQLAALVGYVESLAPKGAPAAARRRVVDPVCKMEFSAGDSDLHVDRAGQRYFFCSDACRRKFLGDPARYSSARNENAR